MLTIKGIYGREMYETWYKMTVMLQSGLDITSGDYASLSLHRIRKRIRGHDRAARRQGDPEFRMIDVRDLTKRFGEFTAVAGVSLRVDPEFARCSAPTAPGSRRCSS